MGPNVGIGVEQRGNDQQRVDQRDRSPKQQENRQQMRNKRNKIGRGIENRNKKRVKRNVNVRIGKSDRNATTEGKQNTNETRFRQRPQ